MSREKESAINSYLNQTIVIPFPANQTVSAVTITIMKLSDGTILVNAVSMAGQSNNIWTYQWITPKVVEQYQVIFNDGSFNYTGPIIEVAGGIIFTVQTGSTASAIIAESAFESTNDFYEGPSLVKMMSGSLRNQTKRLLSPGGYTGATRTFNLADPFTGAPTAGDIGLVITG